LVKMTQRPDPVTWINAVIRNPETGKPFELLPAEINFLEHAFELNEDGTAKYPELVYSAPKKSGKTGFAAILTLTVTLLYGGNDPEAICAANDLEQSASRVFSAIKKIIRASPALRDKARITNTVITFPDVGATITAIASEAAGAAGANPVLTVGDELWGFTSESSRRLWDELVPPPTRKMAWRLVVTYAGFSCESSLLEELYQHGISQPQIGPDLYAGEGQLTFWTHSPVAPWQTPAWLAQMSRSLRPAQYQRLIENRWTSSQSSFIEMAKWDACVDPSLEPSDPDRNLQVYVAVDASLKRDSTAIVAVCSDGERVRLVSHKIFQPSPDAPLDFEATIEAEIIELCASFSVQTIYYDPWQMAAVAQRMIKRGVPMQEYPQTTSNLTDSSSNLFELIKSCSLQVYADDAMRTSVSQAIAVETPRGWRIAKEKAKHKIDIVVALAMACLAAIKQRPVAGWGLLEYYRRQSEALSTQAIPTPQQLMASEAIGQIGSRRPADYVKVIIPTDASHVYAISGAVYMVEVEDGARVTYMAANDAFELINSPLNLAFLEANAALRESLRARFGNRTAPTGMRMRDLIAAAEDARPRHWDDRGGQVNDTLRAMGRLR
jgi:hypothetical protein